MTADIDLQPGDQERTPPNPIEALLPLLQALKAEVQTPAPAPAPMPNTLALEIVREMASALVRTNDLLQRIILEDRAAARMRERE